MYKFGEVIHLWDKVPEVDGMPAQEIPVMECFPAAANRGNRGSVIVLPGGGYCCRVDHEKTPIAGWLNSIGLNAYIVHYRVKPHLFPAGLADVQRAIRLIRDANFKDCHTNHKIGVIGFSAGGNLAGAVATMGARQTYPASDALDGLSCKVDAAILAYAVLPLTEEKNSHYGSVENLLGKDSSAEQRKNACPVEAIDASTPPCFLWHTFQDQTVGVKDSLYFAQGLADHGIPYELHVYPEGGHGLTTLNYEHDQTCSDWMYAARKWLVKQGF